MSWHILDRILIRHRIGAKRSAKGPKGPHNHRRHRTILSPFVACPRAALCSWALGLAGRKFSIKGLAPKKSPMVSNSDTYRPMPAPKSAEETPQKCRPDAKSSALLENPLPPLQWQPLGTGPPAVPSPQAAYISICANGRKVDPTEKNVVPERKIGADHGILYLRVRSIRNRF